jgi:polyvinyl alcohol dehydrogenase (cytochrome)
MHRFSGLLLVAAVSGFGAPADTKPNGAALFEANCAVCHKPSAENRTPPADALKRLSNGSIVASLESGAMKTQGSSLSPLERQAIADFLVPHSTQPADTTVANQCDAQAKPLANIAGWNGWSPDLTNSRYQAEREGGLQASDAPNLKLKWAFGIPNASSMYGQPSIAGGRLFFGTGNGMVYSVDAATGCVYWTFKAPVQVRTAITVGTSDGKYVAYFGDGSAVVYALDAQTGQLSWKTKIDDHKMAGITGAPKLYGGKLYVPVRSGVEEMVAAQLKYQCCTFRGSLVALDAKTGSQLWKTYTIPDPPGVVGKNSAGVDKYGPSGAGVWSSPTIDVKRKAVYVGTGNNYSDPPTKYGDAILAFDLDTGSLRWVKQMNQDVWNYSCEQPVKANCPEKPDRDTDIGTSPILHTLPNGKQVLLFGQKSAMVRAIDPDKRGEIVWEKQIGKGGALGGVMWGLAADRYQVYVPLSDIFPGPAGGLFAFNIATGKQAWYVPPVEPACKEKPGCSAALMAPPTAIPGVVFSGSLDGHLRAYASADGKLVWDFDTLRDFDTVNGVKAHGGSLNATGPTVANGMLFVNSGYSQLTGIGGNVLLAFSAK